MDLVTKDCSFCINDRGPENCQNLEFLHSKILSIVQNLKSDEETKVPVKNGKNLSQKRSFQENDISDKKQSQLTKQDEAQPKQRLTNQNSKEKQSIKINTADNESCIKNQKCSKEEISLQNKQANNFQKIKAFKRRNSKDNAKNAQIDRTESSSKSISDDIKGQNYHLSSQDDQEEQPKQNDRVNMQISPKIDFIKAETSKASKNGQGDILSNYKDQTNQADESLLQINQLTLGKVPNSQRLQELDLIQVSSKFQKISDFPSMPTTPKSKNYHEIGMNKVKEMLVYGGYRNFATFGYEIEQYERCKKEFFQAHNMYIKARTELTSSFQSFHNWISNQAGPNFDLIQSDQEQQQEYQGFQ